LNRVIAPIYNHNKKIYTLTNNQQLTVPQLAKILNCHPATAKKRLLNSDDPEKVLKPTRTHNFQNYNLSKQPNFSWRDTKFDKLLARI
jgi:hypothetical protein